jgi:class 3 adenylate cyclase
MNTPASTPHPERIRWLIPLAFLINLLMVGMIVTYSLLNLWPFLPAHESRTLTLVRFVAFHIASLLPTALSVLYLQPITAWLRRVRSKRTEGAPLHVPRAVLERAANAPFVLGSFCLAAWLLMDTMLFVRVLAHFADLTLGIWVHFVVRPLLAGLIAAAAMTFATESLCRAHVWPVLFAGAAIGHNPRLRKFRVAYRLFLLWLVSSFLPLSAVAMTAIIRVDALGAANDPLLLRVMAVIIFIAASAAVGGAWLALLVSRAMDRPLRRLERAMARLRGGDFTVRLAVSATDEIGALEEGFNLMADRLAASYQTLEARNRELAAALDRVAFLERVKRGLDRFVPDTVRRLIEQDPEAPALRKQARDVTVMFLDIEGYTRLSQELPRQVVSAIVERYFSLFLSDIRAEAGDINETAGDGLMILFQEGGPEAHAAAAVRAALAIREKTRAANREAGEGHPAIAVNIGISSGEGDVGATRFQGVAGERWTFTATGPVTNLAARLGDLAAHGQILLSPETAARVRGRFRMRSLGLRALKNITPPVEVWEVEDDGRQCPSEQSSSRQTGSAVEAKRSAGRPPSSPCVEENHTPVC